MTKEEAKEWLPRPTIISTNSDENHPDNKPWMAYEMAIKALEQEPKTGHWVRISPAKIYECSECGQTVMTDDIECYHYCHGCGAKMEDR